VVLDAPLVVPDGAHDLEIAGEGTVLRASPRFSGAGLLVIKGAREVRVSGIAFEGNRAVLERRQGLPPSDVPFVRFYENNGIVVEDSENITISRVSFREIAGFAVLAARCAHLTIAQVRVSDSGSRNEKGRNNTTGGILLEEGTRQFTVANSEFRNIRGNAVWTHSNYTSPRNGPGAIRDNTFDTIARDAVQVGHATEATVEGNTGARIGYPVEEVDVEGGGTPVAIDTAGNVDRSVYARNTFREINGKCIDLDGFHHGTVRSNVCINRGRAEDYVFGHYAIVFNNTNPDMESEHVTVADNEIDGTKFGGIFVIGSNHRIYGNRLRRLNLAGCTESAAKFGCYHFKDEPGLLRTGIYLGGRAERPAVTRGNAIENNRISGHKMRERCIAAAPGVLLKANSIARNICRNE
jgi:hypothetical protein